MSPEGVQVILKWPEPHKVKDIQLFLGFANFYQQFITNYPQIVVPLTCFTWKNILWLFSVECHSAFLSLKSAFTSTPILTHWLFDYQLTIETNASDYVITGILSLICLNDEICPMAFHSYMLSPVKLNYNTYNKELLTIFKVFC